MTDNDIVEFYTNHNVHDWNKISEEHKQYLENRFSDSLSFKESVWRILYKIEKRPTCQICGNNVNFVGRKNNIFSKTCSNECNRKIHETKHTYSDEELYYRSLSSKDKTKYTCMKRYGVEYAAMLDTNCFKTNNPQKNTQIKIKTKETRIKKYGQYMSPNNINSLQSEQVKTKRKRSYNDTMIERYGATNYRNIEKYRETCLEKYGVDHWSKTEQFRINIANKNEIIQEKRHNTFKLHNSFNTSKPEEQTFDILKEKYPDTIRQYKSDKYPFSCDFYIPSIDLYIECNYHWTHGGHPFDQNNLADQEKLKLWQSKNTKFYNNAIKTWTISDITKYKCAQNNNLNYLLFYNMNDFIKWIN